MVMKIFKTIFILIALFASLVGVAGLGGGTGNETGGFGAENSGNSGFGAESFGSESFSTLNLGNPPTGGGPGGGPILPPVIPLDGGASILIALGLGIGGRKIYKKVINL